MMAQSPIPSVINDRYEVGETIGRGGMATVYVATDRRLGRQVAIKVLRPELARDESFQERFQREAEAVAGLNHHTITSVYDTGEIPPQQPSDVACPYIVMEYVPGRTLRDLIRSGELSPRESVDAMLGILDALGYSHQSGIVHRDIKPANVIITPDGRVKVMDFGIARAVEDTQAALTQTQAVLGTAQYLSPEQARGENVDARSDLYSAACVFFEMLTGRAPFVGEASVDIAAQHVRDTPPAPSELAPHLPTVFDDFMVRGLAKAREDRFQSAQDMQNAVVSLRKHADPDATTVIAPAQHRGAGDDGTRSTAPVFPISAGAAAPGALAGEQLISSGSGASGSSGSPTHNVSRGERGSLFAPMDDDAPVGARRQDQYADQHRRRRKRLWLLPLLVLLLVGSGVAAAFLLREPTPVAVPDVVGMSQEDAEAKIKEVGLVAESTRENSDEVDEDTVISSDPGSGTELEPGSTVKIKVSSGSEKVTVPGELAGQSEVYAREMISNAGLNVSGTSSKNHPSIGRGLVIDTDPKGGSEVARDSDLEIILSTGKVTVPDVVGSSRADAVAALEGGDVQLPVAVATETTSSSPAGTVLRQSTPGGTDVDQGTTVTITVAAAPQRSTPSPSPSSRGGDRGGSSPSNSDQPRDNSDEGEQDRSPAPNPGPTRDSEPDDAQPSQRPNNGRGSNNNSGDQAPDQGENAPRDDDSGNNSAQNGSQPNRGGSASGDDPANGNDEGP